MFTPTDADFAHQMGVDLRCGMCQLLDVQLHNTREAHAATIARVSQLVVDKENMIRKQRRRIDHLMLALFGLACIVAYLVVRG